MKRIFKLYYKDNIILGHLDELTRLIDELQLKEFKLVGVKK